MWDLTEIVDTDPERGVRLLQAPTANELLGRLADALRRALIRGTARFGAQQSSINSVESRAVIQFWVGSMLFDWFFNGPNGYRAQYRADPATGSAFNEKIILEARHLIVELLPPVIAVRLMAADFSDAGGMNIATREWAQSLDPTLSKVWMCGLLIQTDGSQPTSLPLGIDGTRINVGLSRAWRSVSRADADAWFDIKGAFVGSAGCYQPKDPVVRAQRLHTHGEA
jgi:hypothetical protein